MTENNKEEYQEEKPWFHSLDFSAEMPVLATEPIFSGEELAWFIKLIDEKVASTLGTLFEDQQAGLPFSLIETQENLELLYTMHSKITYLRTMQGAE